MKRVAIIGSPGTGKSTFAQQLGMQTGLPLIHLDYFYHDKRHGYYEDRQAWRNKADEFTRNESWIIDGNFGATMAKRLERADTIFYFDMSTCVALKGVVKRWLTARSASGRPGVAKDWQEKPSWSFFWKVVRFRVNYAEGTRVLLALNKNKEIVIFKNHHQVAGYLGKLANSTE